MTYFSITNSLKENQPSRLRWHILFIQDMGGRCNIDLREIPGWPSLHREFHSVCVDIFSLCMCSGALILAPTCGGNRQIVYVAITFQSGKLENTGYVHIFGGKSFPI